MLMVMQMHTQMLNETTLERWESCCMLFVLDTILSGRRAPKNKNHLLRRTLVLAMHII